MRTRTESAGAADASVVGRQNRGGNSSNAYQVNTVSAWRNIIKCIKIINCRKTIKMQKCKERMKFWARVQLGD